ncbi:CLUMA_CG002064, isoform A [Clunio marinus]|uniref:CLUMA_CG002064, isoform A n=1 Tax=Clunio marinus TaxID=568069 RepID=A0A1J1HJT6_9DIPT|nr:CLUMA_CG002064, isoform A [Clunio marinus]
MKVREQTVCETLSSSFQFQCCPTLAFNESFSYFKRSRMEILNETQLPTKKRRAKLHILNKEEQCKSLRNEAIEMQPETLNKSKQKQFHIYQVASRSFLHFSEPCAANTDLGQQNKYKVERKTISRNVGKGIK